MQDFSSHILNPPDNTLIPWWYLIAVYAVLLGTMLVLYPSVSPLIIVAGVVVLIITFYYPVLALVAYIFLGVTKPWVDENVALFQTVDYTVFLAVFMAAFLLIALARQARHTLPSYLHFLPVLFLFAVLLFLGVVHSSAPSYGFEKASRFFIFNILLFIATILFIKEKRDIIHIFAFTVGLSFIFATIMFYEGIRSFVGGDVTQLIVRMTILGADPIGSARIFSVSFLILLVAAYFTPRRRDSIILYILSAYFLVALIVTNTRGPLVSTFAAVIIFVLFISNMKFRTIALYFGLFIAAIASAFLFLPDFLTSRYEVLLDAGAVQQAVEGGEVDTISSRLLMWSMALKGTFESAWTFIFGHGTGSFASLFHFGDIRWYPHNMFLETFYEIGFIGLFVLLLHFTQISIFGRRLYKNLSDRPSELMIVRIIIVGAISFFFAVMVSGDLASNRTFWFFPALLIAAGRIFAPEVVRQRNI